MTQLESTISNLTPATIARLTGTAVVAADDSTAVTVKATLAQIRTMMFAGGTGYTATDPLLVGGEIGSNATALATSATTPFLWVPSTTGTPTGVPAASAGAAIPFVIDTTASKLYARISGAWTGTQLGAAAGINQQLFTSSGTWSKPAGLTMASIECWGGGGGGAGGTSNPTTGTVQDRGGGGGGGGGYGFVTVPLSALAATVSVTIGAAGTGGAGGAAGGQNNGTAGVNGGTTTFGAYISGLLGNGASTAVASGTATGGAAKGPAPSGTADTIYLSGAGGSGGSGAIGLSVYWGGAGGCGAGSDATIYTAATSVSLGVSGGVNGRGYSTGAGVGGNGTVGGIASGGGGGGSGAGGGNAGGNGAAGGAGYCRVTCY